MMHLPTISLIAASRSDQGRVRSNNEDLLLCNPEHGVFAVIDGVGGQAAGEVAAQVARRVILDRLARPLGPPAERVREAIALANNEIFRSAEESPEHHGMTCVLTLALVVDHHLTVGHVGDSRLYKLSPSGIRKLTHDHSPVGEREDARQISELEAMRHPRRNEVYRDLGSEYRDKDDAGFVDVVEDTIEPDCAILLCTDGLSDMVPSSVIANVVRDHVGHPQAVVDALVGAANEAGGKDNITVVYAEGPDFAPAISGRAWRGDVVPGPAVAPGPNDGPTDTVREPLSRRVVESLRWVANRWTTWFACGVTVGVLAALVLAWRLGGSVDRSRTLSVGGTGALAFARIADAMAVARPGDVVQLEPGLYKEQVVVSDGVDLVARLAGASILERDAGAAGEWTPVIAAGRSGGRIYGIRIRSTPEAPVEVAVRISGEGHQIELLDIEGPMRTGIELSESTATAIRACLIHISGGAAVSLDERSEATVLNNAFIRTSGPVVPAVFIKELKGTVIKRNVIAGYGAEIIRGIPRADQSELLSSGNFVMSSAPAIER